MKAKPHIVILGAGPAGLGAAFQLADRNLATVTVIEKLNSIGGNAASFQISDVWVDYGSHRLHPSCEKPIFNDIKRLLGNDLLERPRHGRIRLQDRWIHFPLKPMDLLFKLPVSFSVSAILDTINKIFRKKQKNINSENFATVLEAGLGKTICNDFYFPYARKIWGLSPAELSPIQAYRRVSSNSISKILLKIFSIIPGFKRSGTGRFYYPRLGIGQICNGFYKSAEGAGVDFQLNTHIKSISIKGNRIEAITFITPEKKEQKVDPDYLWSTIPITTLIQLMESSVPEAVIHASEQLHYRAMILVYLVIEQPQFSEYDAHYFPELHIPITRLSEPKNYNMSRVSENQTVLCAELPCSIDDKKWTLSDNDLGSLVYESLKKVSVPIKAPLKKVITRRLSHAYPIYLKNYDNHFFTIDTWVNQTENLLSFGRQGLFAHDNIHHALSMAYSAVNCLNTDGKFDTSKWQNHYRQVFKTHIVED